MGEMRFRLITTLLILFCYGSIDAQNFLVEGVEINGGTTSIYTTQLNISAFISEIEFDGSTQYPYGRRIELTITEGETIMPEQYGLAFYSSCTPGGSDATTISETAKHLLSTLSYIFYNNIVEITLQSGMSAYSTDCPIRGIALYKMSDAEEKLVNFVTIYPNASEQLTRTATIKALDGVAQNHLAVTAGGGIITPETSKYYELSNWDWNVLGSAVGSMGELNAGLSNCAFFALATEFSINGIDFIATVLPYSNRPISKIEGDTRYLVHQNQLPYFKSCDNESWNSNSNIYNWDAYPTLFSEGVTGDIYAYHAKNARTVYAALSSAYPYLLEELNFSNSICETVICASTHNIGFISYNPQRLKPNGELFSWTGDSNPNSIHNKAASLSVTGHEVGHRFWNPIIPTMEFREGFCDISGVLIETHALGNTIPNYMITPTHQSCEQGYRNLTYDIAYDSKNYHSLAGLGSENSSCIGGGGGDWNKSRVLGHWFYLLSEGFNKTIANFPMGVSVSPYTKDINKYVCGIGHHKAALVVSKMHNLLLQYGVSLYNYNILRQYSLASVDNLPAVFPDPEFAKAQIKNAWAAVNVGTADFSSLPPSLKVCQGAPLSLTVTGGAGIITYFDPDNNPLPANGLVALNAGTEHSGTYTIHIDYPTSDISLQPCTLVHEVEVEVKPLLINEGSNLTLCYNQPLHLTYSAHTSVSNIYWTDPNGITLTASTNPDGSLTIPNPISGNYTIWGTCQSALIADQIYITVIDVPTITITPSAPNAEFCLNDSFTLTIEEDYYSSYAWAENGIAISTANVVSGTASQLGATTYSLTVTNANGCTATANTTITVNQPPQVEIIAAPTANCAIQAVSYGGTPPYNFVWIPNEETTNFITVSNTGNYAVVATDANGCTAQAQINLTTADFILPANFTGNYIVGTSTPPLPDADPDPNVEHWNAANLRIAGDITVPTGKTLRITQSIVAMLGGENSQITVQPGAILQIANATIKANDCINAHWKGISVLGSTVPYNSTDFDTEAATGNYGVLITNNAKIENARIGVCNGRLTDTYIAETGGLLRLYHTDFKDNGTAIKMEKFAYSSHQVHDVQNCTVTLSQNNPPIGAPQYWWHPTVEQPVGLWAAGSKLMYPLHNNRFYSAMSAIKSGIGMRLDNVRVTISAETETDPENPQIYEFAGLFKGIDVYNTLTVMKEVNIAHQNFQTTQKGITLNGTVGSIISHNTFVVPTSPLFDPLYNTFALLAYGSIGLTVEHNRILAEQAVPNPYTYGAIFDDTYYSGFASRIQNNLFDGRLKPATQFIGNNNTLQTNCNAYDDCDIDWHLAPNASLPAQGECFSGLPDDALRTHWHYTNEPGSTIGYPNYHIINDSPSTLTLNIDNSAQSDPFEGSVPSIYVVGNVMRDFCSEEGDFQNQSCEVIFPEEGAGMADCDNEGDIERRIYNFLRNNQRDSLLALLHCLDTDWAIRLLVGTYVDERLYEQALAELQRLPNTPENAEFTALYMAIIVGGLEGSGKSSAATATVNNIAENMLSKNSYLAQSVLAVYTGADYVRHGIPVRTNLKYNATFPDFDLTPNPANNTVSVLFRKPITQKCHLQIYHLSGQLVKSLEISPNSTVMNMNIENMATGIYFCRLSTGTTTSKLVVIK